MQSHEQIPLATTSVTEELEQLQQALDHQSAEIKNTDTEALADLYGLTAKAKSAFEDRRKELRDELLDRVTEDRRIQGSYASVDRATQQRRTTKLVPEVLTAIQQAGIDRDEVFTLDSSKLRKLSEEGKINESMVFDSEGRPYIRVRDTSL